MTRTAGKSARVCQTHAVFSQRTATRATRRWVIYVGKICNFPLSTAADRTATDGNALKVKLFSTLSPRCVNAQYKMHVVDFGASQLTARCKDMPTRF